jgi:hypothetical protein
MTLDEAREYCRKYNLPASITLNPDGTCEIFAHQEGLDEEQDRTLAALKQVLEYARYKRRKRGDDKGPMPTPKPKVLT